MQTVPRSSVSTSRLILEIAGVFLVSFLLAALRVAIPEPTRADLAPRIESRAEADPNANPRYDRPNDERDYYFPLIRAIHSRWPSVDLRTDSLADKPPGYPFFMAAAAKLVGLDLDRLRGVHAAWSASIAALLYAWLRRRWSMLGAWTLLAPFAFSSFYVKSSAYLTTDNPALFFVVLGLLVILARAWPLRALAVLLVCNVSAVWIRQNTLWLVAPTLLLAGVLAPGWRQDNAAANSSRPFAPFLLALAAAVFPCLLMGHLWLAWHGFVPPTYYQKATYPGLSLAPVAYCLSVFAICWWPYVLCLRGWRASWAGARASVSIASALVGLVVVLLADMTYSQQTGNWGGYLWTVSSKLPAWHGRSPVFLLLAPLGSWAIATAIREIGPRDRFHIRLFIAALFAWLLTCMANPYAFHRYYEPSVLVFVIVLAANAGGESLRPYSLRHYALLLLFAAGQLAITIATLFLSLFPHLRR